jgi:hypothetical protein
MQQQHRLTLTLVVYRQGDAIAREPQHGLQPNLAA